MAFSEKYMRFVIVLVTVVSVAGQTCLSLGKKGYTVPQGDITIRYGETLNITCNLHKEFAEKYGPNASSRLYFMRNNSLVSPEMVTIVNSTSIKLSIAEHPKTWGDKYFCHFNASESKPLICMNVVYVGVPPQPITKFSCISKNCDNLTCTWTPPENYVKTEYDLKYNLKSRSARNPFECPKIVNNKDGSLSCFWDITTKPQYRPSHDCYYFIINMSNMFGRNNFSYTFEHFKYVIPNPPENLVATATSPHSINLTWKIPSSMVTFPGLDHKILYLAKGNEWHLADILTNSTNKQLSYELKNLKYAHFLYDIRVYMRSSMADKTDETMWSKFAPITVLTKSKEPDVSPRTNIGSFEINDNQNSRDVYIYWQKLRDEEWNGANLKYIVEVENNPSINTRVNKSFVKLEKVPLTEYVVNIWSVNEIGRSPQKSTVVIPAKPLDRPYSFIKERSGDTYELTWTPPANPESEALVTSYTIFWCTDDVDKPRQCEGKLDWEEVPKNKTKFKRTLPLGRFYEFAISANSGNKSSGMLWAQCMIIPNKSLGRIENVWIKSVGHNFIDVGWILDCPNRISTIAGFIIYYCPVQPSDTTCNNGGEKNITIKGDVNTVSGKVTGLTPSTTYRITVSYILNDSTISTPSKELRNTTYESAPTPPLNVTVTRVTNSSITLTWQPPAKMNGYLKNYYVYYNKNIINCTDNETTLTDLMSYTNYTIYVEACTVNCSKASDRITVTTEMSAPAKLNQPYVKSKNDSYATVVWEKPNPAGGKVDYYQVKMKERPNGDDYTIENVTFQHYTLKPCGKHNNELYIAVRAVNVIGTSHKPGIWSEDFQIGCSSGIPILYVLIGSLIIFLGVAMICIFRKLYVSFMDSKKFIPTLPPGLELDIEIWNSEKLQDPNPLADSQHLLQKNNETHLSGDSSGCSSGHESITSSLESTAHISASDSGTEQPRSPALSEESRKKSLRLRNVSAAPRPTINSGYVTADTLSTNLISKSSTPSPGNYCILGVDPASTTKRDPPYVPISDLNTKLAFSCDPPQPSPYMMAGDITKSSNPGYIMAGDIAKSSNPGYVPNAATEGIDKNKGYVAVGFTTDLLSTDLLQCDTPKSDIKDEKSLYISASETIPTLKTQFPWQQSQQQPTLPKSGYVSVGDAPPPKSTTEVRKGYVPHRQFDGKILKED